MEEPERARPIHERGSPRAFIMGGIDNALIGASDVKIYRSKGQLCCPLMLLILFRLLCLGRVLGTPFLRTVLMSRVLLAGI